MQKSVLLLSITAVLCVFISQAAAQVIVPVRLADVRSVYVDDRSFRITSSSCGTYAGGMYLPCPQQSNQRIVFLAALKRWLDKSGFTVIDDKAKAEAVLQGTLYIDDRTNRNGTYGDHGPYRKKGRDPDKLPSLDEVPSENRQALFEPQWSVMAWLANQDGQRIWTLGAGYPGISYSGEKGKIEGKKLAKAFQYDFKHYH